MKDDRDWLWVHIDLMRFYQACAYRCRMLASDFEAITTGGFVQPFVLVEDVHWVEMPKDEKTGRQELKLCGFGLSGVWRHFAGSYYLKPETITSIAPLRDGYGREHRLGRFAESEPAAAGSERRDSGMRAGS